MSVPFTKMHGLGNDFIVFEARDAADVPSAARLRALADRHTGIGFDQALLIAPARSADAVAHYRIFNADGGEVEQCGNGARCVAEWLRLEGRATQDVLRLECAAGPVAARFVSPGVVSIDMGIPSFDPASLPFDATLATRSQNDASAIERHALVVARTEVHFGAVSMGNPHIVIRVPDVAVANVATLGPLLESHAAFAHRVNVGFLEIVDRTHGRLRVYERGVGETQACGTGACAAMAVARAAQLFDAEVQMQLPGGTLKLNWGGANEHLWMTGPAAVAFRGELPDWSEHR